MAEPPTRLPFCIPENIHTIMPHHISLIKDLQQLAHQLQTRPVATVSQTQRPSPPTYIPSICPQYLVPFAGAKKMLNLRAYILFW